MAKLVIKRTKAHIGRLTSMKYYINGKKEGSIRDSGREVIELEEGVIDFKIKTPGCIGSKTVKLELKNDRDVTVFVDQGFIFTNIVGISPEDAEQ